MTESDFWARIDAAPADRFTSTEVIDWGGMPRGAGRRRGKMIMGAMSDPARGKKTYTRILGKADLTDLEREEAEALEAPQQVLIARALAAGFSTDAAFLAGYTVGPDPITRSQAFEIASKYGYL